MCAGVVSKNEIGDSALNIGFHESSTGHKGYGMERLDESIVRVVNKAWRQQREMERSAAVEKAVGLQEAFEACFAAQRRGDTAEADRQMNYIQTVEIPNEDPFFTSSYVPSSAKVDARTEEELEAEAEAEESAIEELEERQQERAATSF